MRKTGLFLLLLAGLSTHAQESAPTPDQVRMMIAQSITQLGVKPEPVAEVINQTVTAGTQSIPIRIYKPATDGPLPVIYLVHGGAWVAGDLDTHDNICRYLANRVEAIVVALHYRRPPEHPHPAAYDDSQAVLQWIAANQQTLGGNGQLVLLGDSAGGQLVAALCLGNAARENPLPITAQVLVNPGLNLTAGTNGEMTYRLFVNWYLPPNADRSDYRISPLLANSFAGLPPALVVVGEKDELREDGEDYHAKLQAAGISSELYLQPGAGHLAGLWCAGHEMARPAMVFVTESLKKLLAKKS